MSVIVKGMKMPKNCIECVAQFGGICFVAPAEVDDTQVAPTVDEAYEKGKPEWCPLVEIPTPHGRLIDADAYKRYLDKEWIPANHDAIDAQPTVIESEGI